MNKWIACIIALIIGMLMYHMLSNVCGCMIVEGNKHLDQASDYEIYDPSCPLSQINERGVKDILENTNVNKSRCWGVQNDKYLNMAFRDEINIEEDKLMPNKVGEKWKKSYQRKLALSNYDALIRNSKDLRTLKGPKNLYCLTEYGFDVDITDCINKVTNETWIRVHSLKTCDMGHAGCTFNKMMQMNVSDSDIFSFKPGNKNLSNSLIDKCLPKNNSDYLFNSECSSGNNESSAPHDFWVTLGDDIIYTLWTKGENITNMSLREFHKRIYQLIGLNSGWGSFNYIVSFDVKIKDLVRPCSNPNPLENCDVGGIWNSDSLSGWLKNLKDNNLGVGSLSNAPFTGFGYTYDINNATTGILKEIGLSESGPEGDGINNKNIQGCDEYLVPFGVEIKNPSVISISDYFINMKRKYNNLFNN